jgi:two-component system, response regulator PdtaR
MVSPWRLRDLGCTVLGPVSSVAETLALLGKMRPDVALLDVHMLDGAIAPVAAWLTRSGVPFVVTTADETAGHEPALSGAVLLPKPYSVGAIRQAICRVLTKKT